MGILWIIIIGFVAGLIARFLAPGSNNPSGFILTTMLGIAGAFLATWIGQAIGHYGPDQGAGLIDVGDRRGGRAFHLAPPGGGGHDLRSRQKIAGAPSAPDRSGAQRAPRDAALDHDGAL